MNHKRHARLRAEQRWRKHKKQQRELFAHTKSMSRAEWAMFYGSRPALS